MSRIRALSPSVVLAAALLGGSAFAAELTPDETKWVEQCVANLASKSALVRDSAEKAVGGLRLDALPTVVAASAKLETDADWRSLARALGAMNGGVSKSLEELKPSWPKGTEVRFAALIRSLDDVDVGAKVRAILAKFRGVRRLSIPNPEQRQIVAFGRAAVASLVEALCEPAVHSDWALRSVAKYCFGELADESDVPMIGKMVRSGHAEFGAALGRLSSPEAVALVAELIRTGRFGTELDEMATPHLGDAAVAAACCAWLREPNYEGDMEFAIAKMADVVSGEDQVTVPDAVEPLAKLLERPLRTDSRRRVASALVRLGDKRGVPALIDVLESSAETDMTDTGYERHAAGEHLNSVSGTKTYVGTALHDDKTDYTRWTGNFAEAAKQFRAWWEKSKDKLAFDAATRTWSVK
jgi:HEAT repeat protein